MNQIALEFMYSVHVHAHVWSMKIGLLFTQLVATVSKTYVF